MLTLIWLLGAFASADLPQPAVFSGTYVSDETLGCPLLDQTVFSMAPGEAVAICQDLSKIVVIQEGQQ